jgi:heme exporter protein D
MMPDLGRYAFAVLASYAASAAILGVLIGASLWRAARMRAALRRVEAQREAGDA